MNLQLAESAPLKAHMRRKVGLSAGVATKPYIFIPGRRAGEGTYIREDLLDAMPDNQYRLTMKRLAPHQREVKHGMSEEDYTLSKSSRRQERKDRKKQKAQDKHDKRASKVEARKTKAAAKMERAKAGKGRKAAQDALDFSKDLIKSKVGGKGGNGTPDDDEKKPFYKTTGGIIAISAGALLLLGGLGYAVSKKKK